MRFFSPLLIFAALLAAACGGAAVLPDEFTRERADGKIPVSIPLIRQQTKKEIDGMPEGQAKVERWQQIEKDHNQCRLLSARSNRVEANEVFAACMSKRDYVYMYRLDAEQLHDDIAAQMVAKHKAEEEAAKKSAEEERIAAKKKAEEERQRKEHAAAVERQQEKERRAAEQRREEKARREKHLAEQRKLDEALVQSAHEENWGKLKRLLAAGADVNATDRHGLTALGLAQLKGDVGSAGPITKFLLDAGANVKTANDSGQTPLMFAAGNGEFESVKMFLSAGADVKAVDKEDWTPLIYAAANSRMESAKMLLAAGADIHAVDEKGQTPLIKAAINASFSTANGEIEFVKMLLDAGADINAMDKKGLTALNLVIEEERDDEIVKFLLAAGANRKGMTYGQFLYYTDKLPPTPPLIRAVAQGNLPEVHRLLAAGANPDVVDANGLTALVNATSWRRIKIVKALLAAGANPNAPKESWAALIWAASNTVDNPELTKILLDAGANPNAVGIHGKTALEIAKENGNDKTAEVIRAAMLNLQAADLPETVSPAAQVFENAWRHIVVVKRGENQGSGVIVRPNVVATNCHVIDSSGGITSLFSGDDEIIIHKHDNRRASTDTLFNATIRKRDDDRDFCLLDAKGLQGTSAKLRQYDTLQIGEAVYAVGSPKGLDLSLSSGLISQLRQGDGFRVIQTDAAISPGSSGGGLFDSNGNLIGILTSKITDENVEGIGFAIPADLAAGL